MGTLLRMFRDSMSVPPSRVNVHLLDILHIEDFNLLPFYTLVTSLKTLTLGRGFHTFMLSC